MIDTCGDCGCARDRCECGPRWIRESLEASWHSGRAFTELAGHLAKAMIERLPLVALTAAVIEQLGGDSGAGQDDRVTLDYADRVVKAVVATLTADAEVVTLTELYQNAARALDHAGVPYGVERRVDETGLSGPGGGTMLLDMPARIRWLAAQRPTRLEMAREISTAVAAAAPDYVQLRAELDETRAEVKRWQACDARSEALCESRLLEINELRAKIEQLELTVASRDDRLAELVSENENQAAIITDLESALDDMEDQP